MNTTPFQIALTAERARESFSYDPETGVLRWLISSGRGRPGCVAGHRVKAKRYFVVRIDGSIYYAHRIIFLMMTGRMPIGDIDHINRDRSDNRWINLREVSRAANAQNTVSARSCNLVGLLGVSAHNGKFQSRIAVGGNSRHLGTFPTKEAAHEAYMNAKKQLHPWCEFGAGGKP